MSNQSHKVQGPDTAVKFIGVLWFSITYVIRDNATDKRACPVNMKDILRAPEILANFHTPSCTSSPSSI